MMGSFDRGSSTSLNHEQSRNPKKRSRKKDIGNRYLVPDHGQAEHQLNAFIPPLLLQFFSKADEDRHP